MKGLKERVSTSRGEDRRGGRKGMKERREEEEQGERKRQMA